MGKNSYASYLEIIFFCVVGTAITGISKHVYVSLLYVA